MKLSVRQERFCIAYAKSGNASQAYRDAGYAVNSDAVVGVNACRLLKMAKIQARLEELAEEMRSAKIADAREIQELLTAIARGELTEETVVVEGCGDGISEARKINKGSALKDRIKAAETLAKMQGAFDTTLKVQMTVPVFGGEDDLDA